MVGDEIRNHWTGRKYDESVVSESQELFMRINDLEKMPNLQSKVNNNLVKLIKRINKRLDKLEKDNEIDLENIKVGLND